MTKYCRSVSEIKSCFCGEQAQEVLRKVGSLRVRADNVAVDDMAERCDRLEQEMLMREGGMGLDTRSKSSLKSGESLGEGSI